MKWRLTSTKPTSRAMFPPLEGFFWSRQLRIYSLRASMTVTSTRRRCRSASMNFRVHLFWNSWRNQPEISSLTNTAHSPEEWAWWEIKLRSMLSGRLRLLLSPHWTNIALLMLLLSTPPLIKVNTRSSPIPLWSWANWLILSVWSRFPRRKLRRPSEEGKPFVTSRKIVNRYHRWSSIKSSRLSHQPVPLSLVSLTTMVVGHCPREARGQTTSRLRAGCSRAWNRLFPVWSNRLFLPNLIHNII